MTDNKTKVHCWSFASGIGTYVANQKVCIEEICDAVKVTPKQTKSTPGVRTCMKVCPNTDYLMYVRGSASSKNAFLWVQDAKTKKRLTCETIYLQCQPCWVCVKFNTGCATKVDLGVLFTCPDLCDCMSLHDIEVYRCEQPKCCCHHHHH